MVVPAAAQADNSSILPLKMRGKDWCQSSSASAFPNGKSRNFNLRHVYDITLNPDLAGTGAITARLSKDPGSDADASLTEFDLHGQGLFRNKSNHKIEFVLHGVHPDIPGISLTMRGEGVVNKDTGAIKRVRGTFVYERDDNDPNNDPAVHCFGNGTFGTKKKHDDDDDHHSDDKGKSKSDGGNNFGWNLGTNQPI